MTNCSFAIITPSFNQSQFILETLNSVVSQTETGDNYLVVDGNSSDLTVAVLKKSKGLAWISETDTGQTNAINKGIKILRKKVQSPKTTIFAYINSDDYYLPETLKSVRAYFNAHPDCIWLTGDAIIVDQNSHQIQLFVQLYKKVWRLFPLKHILPILNPIAQPATFIRWSALEKIGAFNEELSYTMDYDYWLRLLKKYGPPDVLSQQLAAFRIHPSSKGGALFHKQFAEQYLVAAAHHSTQLQLLLQKLHNLLITASYTMIK